MFAQANSEHCRHKIFNAEFVIDGVAQPLAVRPDQDHHRASPGGRAVGVQGQRRGPRSRQRGRALLPRPDRVYRPTRASHTSAQGRDPQPPDRDRAVPGRGHRLGRRDPRRGRDRARRQAQGRPGRLHGVQPALPGAVQPWEVDHGKPDRIASALDIMLDGPLGGAAFNNEFGRPAIGGYFRTFEQTVPGPTGPEVRGYHKPIMIAGGIGNVRGRPRRQAAAAGRRAAGVLGGPALLIGLGGGAASSMAQGASHADLDFASVQRDNAEIQRRCQEVIDALLGARRRQPDPVDPRRRRRRPVERAARAGPRRRPRRALRPAGHPVGRSGDGAGRAVVQRGAGALRARAGAPAARPSSRRCAPASARRGRCWGTPPPTAGCGSTTRCWARRRSTCRST
jgi:phosphoribosylformylglycinamidine synthase